MPAAPTSPTGYAIIKNGEIFLFRAQDHSAVRSLDACRSRAARTRKLLMHRAEIDRLVGQVERKGYTLIPTALCTRKNNNAKLEIGLAQGRRTRQARRREGSRWQIEKQRTMRAKNRDA